MSGATHIDSVENDMRYSLGFIVLFISQAIPICSQQGWKPIAQLSDSKSVVSESAASGMMVRNANSQAPPTDLLNEKLWN